MSLIGKFSNWSEVRQFLSDVDDRLNAPDALPDFPEITDKTRFKRKLSALTSKLVSVMDEAHTCQLAAEATLRARELAEQRKQGIPELPGRLTPTLRDRWRRV